LHHQASAVIAFFTFSGQEQKNNIVRYNYIHDVEDLGGTGRVERGFAYGNINNDNPSLSQITGNMFYYNIIANVKQEGIRTKSWKQASGYSWSFLNNIVYNAGTSFAWNEFSNGDPGFELKNNIFIEPTGLHIEIGNYASGDDHSGIVMTNNLYYPEDGFQWGTQTYTSFSDWQTNSGKGQNSVIADPLLIDPAHGDFHINMNSPAIDAGTNLGLTIDFDGNSVTLPSDIGAYEYDFRIGYSLSGYIDEVAIWERVLTNAEIDYLYNNGNGIVVD
jgi:hypothetical protein